MVAVQKSPEARIRARFAREAHKLRMTYDAALWAMERRLKRSNPQVTVRIRGLRRDIEAAFGLPTEVLRTDSRMALEARRPATG